MKSLKGYIDIRKKPTVVVAEDDNLFEIVKDGILKFGKDADLNYIDTSRCTSFAELFYKCFFNNIDDVNPDVSKWNVSNVYDFSYCFCVTAFNGDLSEWDMSSAQNMNSMFNDDKAFEGIGLEQWAPLLGKVNNARYMFQNTQITGKQLEEWKFSKEIQYVDNMFHNCKKLDCNLSNWNLSHLARQGQYAHMIKGCNKMKNKPEMWPRVKMPEYLFG